MGLGFLFSLLVFGNVLSKNPKIDKIIADNVKLSVVLFITIALAALFTNYVLDHMKNAMFQKPDLVIEILKILNYQVFLFTLLYFFMDTIFHNAYIPMPFSNRKASPIVNAGILIVFSIFYKIKNRDCTLKQWIITVAVSSILILQINYIEILFLLMYFLVFSIMKKNKHMIAKLLESDASCKRRHFAKILSVVILLSLSAIFSVNLYSFIAAIVVMAVVIFIVYQSKAVFLSFSQ